MKAIKGFMSYHITEEGWVWSDHIGAFLKQDRVKGGYYRVRLHKDRVYHRFMVNRLVAEAFIPNPYGKPQVDHINGVRTDNSVENLRWVTAKENHIYAARSGRKAQKLIESDVKMIRALRYIRDFKLSTIAEMYGVSYQTIFEICRGRYWAWLV